MKPNDDRRKGNNPFDVSKKRDEYQKIIHMMRNIMQNALRDLTRNNLKPGIIYMYGFNIYIEKDGTPHIEQVDSNSDDCIHQSVGLSDLNENDSLFDLIEYYDSVAITIEIFGVESKNISIDVYDKRLVIEAVDDKWHYQEIINLPCFVDEHSTVSTYENGVLDIHIDKKFLFK